MKDLFGNEVIRTLGLYQPYASLMLHGKIESRWVVTGKKAPFPIGKYLIYSTKKAYSDNEFCHMASMFYSEAKEKLRHDKSVYYNGYALALGELYKVQRITGIHELRAAFYTPSILDKKGEYFEFDGRTLWGLHFMNVRRIEPFKFNGKQGVGILSSEDKSKIKYV